MPGLGRPGPDRTGPNEPGGPAIEGASLDVTPGPEATTISLGGEIDLTNVDLINDALDKVIASAPSRLVVDLASVEFMDSSGLAVLVGLARRVPDVAVRNPSPIIRRMIEATGLADYLRLTPGAS